MINFSEDLSAPIELLIIFIPIKRIPRPAIISPKSFFLSSLENWIRQTPIKAKAGAMSPMPTESKTPFIVAPIFAPIIIPTVCDKSIMPALTKPTSITVVADED